MDPTTQELQRELATWICPQCKRHYSRPAAESEDWRCEGCDVPLLDVNGQKFEERKAA